MNVAFIDKRVGVKNVALSQHPGILVLKEISLHEVLESGACFLMFRGLSEIVHAVFIHRDMVKFFFRAFSKGKFPRGSGEALAPCFQDLGLQGTSRRS